MNTRNHREASQLIHEAYEKENEFLKNEVMDNSTKKKSLSILRTKKLRSKKN